MKNWRRYEILLPLQFNDGRRVPKTLLAQIVKELEGRFGAVSCETQIIQGRWRSTGKAFRDDLMRIYVDAEYNEEVQGFLHQIQGATQNALPATRRLADQSFH